MQTELKVTRKSQFKKLKKRKRRWKELNLRPTGLQSNVFSTAPEKDKRSGANIFPFGQLFNVNLNVLIIIELILTNYCSTEIYLYIYIYEDYQVYNQFNNIL